jgi:signal transduction histidine kinase
VNRLGTSQSSSESEWGGTTEDFDQLPRGEHTFSPGYPSGGTPTRLAAERDVLAIVAAAYTLAIAFDIAWSLIVWDIRGPVGPWPVFALVVPHLFVLAAALGTAYGALPTARWLRPEELGRPAPLPGQWLLRALGLLAAPLYPLLEARDRREQARQAPRAEVEQADRALIAVPRAVATAVFVGLAVTAVSDAIVARAPLLWSWPTTIAHALLWMTIAAPLAALAAACARRSLRGELLASPLAQIPLPPNAPRMTAGLHRGALWLMLAGVSAPLLGTHLWLKARTRADAVAEARTRAEGLVEVAAPVDELELGRRLAAAPGAAVTTARGAQYGSDMSLRPGEDGLIDRDGDGDFDHFAHQAAGARAVVPLRRVPEDDGPLLLFAACLALTCGAATTLLRARRSERDLAATRAQIGDAPAAPPPDAPEWRALANAIDALITRMHEETIARFVALEKAEETDRLRSQFLANMSHDLRSPLNSILGFSSLLLRGVDGRLDADTKEMVETIAAAGRDLLHQIDAILDMARIEARRIEKQAEPVPLAPLISKAVQRARVRGGDHINYTVEAVPGLPTAFVDPRHLVQALENLLLFAGKRMTGGALNIKLRRGDPESSLGLQLHVTTPLKPAGEQQMGLARKGFHRLPGHRGLGLELPIADALLKIEGCRLDAREVGQAMVFKIHLPAAESRNPVPVIERAPVPELTPPPAPG